MKKKGILLVLGLTLLTLTLAGCAAGNAKTLGQTQSPAATFTPAAATMAPTMAPAATAAQQESTAPGNAPMTDDGMVSSRAADSAGAASGMTPAEAGKLAERVAEAVERISEIDDAEVIVRDSRALVAVEFEEQYRAGLDERMKKMITDAVMKVDENLTEVEITDDGTLYGQVKSLAGRIGKATGFDELADDIGSLWDRVTGK